MIRQAKLWLLLLIALFSFATCGRTKKNFGGIVDNGNTPTAGDKESPLIPVLEKPFTLFQERYELRLPSAYIKLSATDNEESFADADRKSALQFRITSPTCPASRSTMTANGFTIYYCKDLPGNLLWSLEAPSGQIIEVRSSLSAELLSAIVDTMIQR